MLMQVHISRKLLHPPDSIEAKKKQHLKAVPAPDVIDDCGLRLLRLKEMNTNRINE